MRYSVGLQYKRLFIIQKKCLRTICLSKYNAHTDPLFKKLNLLKVDDIFKLACLKLYHKHLNNELPHYFNYIFETRQHNYNLRNVHMVTTLSSTSRSSKRLKIFFPILLNQLPDLIKQKLYTHSFYGFSQYMKKFVIASYNDSCDVSHCYICNLLCKFLSMSV